MVVGGFMEYRFNNKLKNKYNNIEDEENKKTEAILDELLNVMLLKFDYEQTVDNLKCYIYTGNKYAITSTNDLRNRCLSIKFDKLLTDYLKRNKITLEHYIEMFIKKQESFESDMTYIKNALKINTEVYDIEQTYEAIKEILVNGDYKMFTNEMNTRENLMNYVVDFKESLCLLLKIKKTDNIEDILEASFIYLDNMTVTIKRKALIS